MRIVRRLVLTSILLASFVTSAAAQITGYPQRPPAKQVLIDAQCQWREEPAPLGIIDPAWQHTHIQTWPNLYETVAGLIRIPFNIVTRNLKGYVVVDIARQELVTKIEWDDIGEQSYRALFGNPTGIKNWPGHITIDPKVDHGGHKFGRDGWYSPQFEVNTFFDTGANITQLVRLPYYDLAPNTLETSHFPVLIASCYPHTFDVAEWGTNYVEADTYLPTFSISELIKLIATSAAYGGNEIGMGIWKVLTDFDLHMGKPGRVIDEQHEENFNGADRAPVLDPAVLGSGPHPVAFVWSKPTRDDSQEVTVLLKFNVTVGDDVPPPATCQDPTANNQGAPLPCTYDPLPPTEEWRPVTTFIRELFIDGVTTGRFQLCKSATECKELVVKE